MAIFTINNQSPSWNWPGIGSEFSLTFEVSARSSGDSSEKELNVSYQWSYEGKEIPGENSSTLLLPDIGPYEDGVYTCVATALDGEEESSTEAPFHVVINPVRALMSLTRQDQNFSAGDLISCKNFFATQGQIRICSSGEVINYSVTDGFATTSNPLRSGQEERMEFLIDGAFICAFNLPSYDGTFTYGPCCNS